MKTEIKLNVHYRWSRIHSPKLNYLTIEQSATIFIEGQNKQNTSVNVKNNNLTNKVNVGYESESKFSNLEHDNTEFVKECMDKSNVATDKYKYFRVIFANGYEIVCTDYDEFLSILENKS